MYITDLTRGFLGLDGGRSISTGTVTGPVVVVPLPPPVITQPPVAVIGQMGGAIKLTITATGATGYQWQKQDPLTNAWAPVANGANITGAATATLEISNAAAGDAGKYRCVASNKDSYTESVAVNVQVIAAPGISTQPVDTQQTAPGAPVTLTVLATGNVTGYQWKRGTADAPYPSARSSTLTIPAADVAAGAAFDWWCEVTGPGGTTATNKVKISEAVVIKLPPVITQPLRDTSAEAGSAARFVTYAKGTGTLRYTWKYSAADGTGVTTIANGDQTFGTVTVKWSGADTNDLNLDAAPLALNGFKVWVEITDDNGATASDKVTFTVTKPNYIALITTTGGTFDQIAEGVMALELETGKEFTGYIRSIPAGQPPTDNNSGFSATVTGADKTIATADITGTLLRIRGVASGVIVLAIKSGTNTGKLTVTIRRPDAVAITKQPVNTTQADPADDIALTLKAVGIISGYQWKHSDPINPDGINAVYPGADTDTLTIPAADVIAAAAFDWWCVVTGPGGSTVSNKVKIIPAVTVVITTQPTDINPAKGAAASFTVSATGTGTLRYQWKYSAADGTGVTTITNGDQTFGAETVTWSGATEATLNMSVAALGLSGSLFWVEITDDSGDKISNKVKMIVIKPHYMGLVNTTGGTFAQVDEGVMTLELFEGETFTGGVRNMAPGTAPSDNGTGVSASITGGDSAIATAVLANRTLTITGVSVGTTEFIIHGGRVDELGKLTVTVKKVVFEIRTQPQDVTATTGDPVEFVVTAAGGSGTYNYQWRGSKTSATDHGNLISNGSIGGTGGRSIISGASEATLKFDHIYPNIYTWVHCVVTDASDATVTATSNAAKLTVNPPPAAAAPVITQQPVSTPSVGGRKAIFTVQATVTGTPALSYQWMYKDSGGTWYALSDDVNGVHITGSKTDTLRLNDDTLSGSAILCRVINSPAGFTPALAETDGTAIYTAT